MELPTQGNFSNKAQQTHEHFQPSDIDPGLTSLDILKTQFATDPAALSINMVLTAGLAARWNRFSRYRYTAQDSLLNTNPDTVYDDLLRQARQASVYCRQNIFTYILPEQYLYQSLFIGSEARTHSDFIDELDRVLTLRSLPPDAPELAEAPNQQFLSQFDRLVRGTADSQLCHIATDHMLDGQPLEVARYSAEVLRGSFYPQYWRDVSEQELANVAHQPSATDNSEQYSDSHIEWFDMHYKALGADELVLA